MIAFVRVQDIGTFEVAIVTFYDNMTLLFSQHSRALEKFFNSENVYADTWS